jgi:hypothetical protein
MASAKSVVLNCGRNRGSDKTDPYLAEYTGASGNNGDFNRHTPEIPICMFAERNRILRPLIIRSAPRQGIVVPRSIVREAHTKVYETH